MAPELRTSMIPAIADGMIPIAAVYIPHGITRVDWFDTAGYRQIFDLRSHINIARVTGTHNLLGSNTHSDTDTENPGTGNMIKSTSDVWERLDHPGDANYVLASSAANVEWVLHLGEDDAHHDPVTLDANANTLLELTTQEVGLDTQAANALFAGPAAGVDAIPTFRTIAHSELTGVGADDHHDRLHDVEAVADHETTETDTDLALRPDGAGSVVFEAIDHSELTGVGADDHHDAFVPADIDTLVELNAIVGDATLDDAGDPRDPNDHAHTAAGDGGTVAHTVLTDVSDDDHHDPVTLDADADVLLSLSTQEIGFDDQGANEVLVGPSTGADAVPTFRALDARDMPSSLAEQIFTADDGLLLLNSNCPMTPDSWTSQRGQVATLEGAFHTVQGPFAGSRGLLIEPETTNYCTNPAMYDGDGSDRADNYGRYNNLSGTPTESVIAHPTRSGVWVQRIEYTGEAGDSGGNWIYYIDTAAASFSPGDDCTCSIDVWGTSDTNDMRIIVQAFDSGGSYLDGSTTGITVSETVQRVSVTYTSLPANTDHVRMRFDPIRGANDGDDFDVKFGAVNIEKYENMTTYVDGNRGSEYAWTGTEHDSTSTRSATEANLDDLTYLVSDNNVYSIALWIRVPYDTDDTWIGNGTLLDIYEDASNRVSINYGDGLQQFRVNVDGSIEITSSEQSFSANDWIFIALTVDYSADDINLYLHGENDGQCSPGASAISPGNMNLGTLYNGLNADGYAIGEYAILDRVLSAEEVAALYHRDAPMVDVGAFDTPVVDGRFMRLPVSYDDVSDPPTDAELTVSFGCQPDGFTGIVDDNGAATKAWKVWRASNVWWYEELTKAV